MEINFKNFIQQDSENDTKSDAKNQEKKKKKTPGVIYLSKIPTKMNVKLIRDYFSRFGDVDRIYLEPQGNHFQSILSKNIFFKTYLKF